MYRLIFTFIFMMVLQTSSMAAELSFAQNIENPENYIAFLKTEQYIYISPMGKPTNGIYCDDNFIGYLVFGTAESGLKLTKGEYFWSITLPHKLYSKYNKPRIFEWRLNEMTVYDSRDRTEQIIAMDIDNSDLLFIIGKNTENEIYIPEFGRAMNTFYLANGHDKKLSLGETIGRIKQYYYLNSNALLWRIDFLDSYDYRINQLDFFKIYWHIYGDENNEFLPTSIAFIQNTDTLSAALSLWSEEQNKVDFCIAKIITDQDTLSFACIVNNKSSQAIKFPQWGTAENTLTINFANNTTLNIPLKRDNDEPIVVLPGESSVYSIDVSSLLQTSKEHSTKDFEYGISKLVWQLILPSGEIVTRTFYLIKFCHKLPIGNGSGYKVNGDLNDTNTFTNHLFEILPPAQAKEDED